MAETVAPPRTSPGALTWTVRNLVKADRFGDFKKGDKVKVVFDPGDIMSKFNGARFEFLAHVTNIENGKQWVDLWGGLPKHEALVSVRPDKIVHA